MTHQRAKATAAVAGDPGPAAEDRTLGQLVADASRDLSEIAHAEMALAKAELKQDVARGAAAGGLFGAAGYLAVLASVTGVITIGYALVAVGLPAWAAFAIVTGVLLLVAGVLVLVGRSQIRRISPPERAIRSAKATIAAVRPAADGR